MPNVYLAFRPNSDVNLHRTTTIALVFAVLLAGCSGIGGQTESPTSTQTTDPTSSSTTPPTSSTTAQTSATTSTNTQTSTKDTGTTTEIWVQPKPPKTPFQVKNEDRIKSVKFVDKAEAKSGNGYSNFNLEVRANTLMTGVDPDSDGEPYFVVKINGKIVTRKSVQWDQKEDGTYKLKVLKGALKRFDSGPLKVKVLLLEEDKKRADMYSDWQDTIEYSSE